MSFSGDLVWLCFGNWVGLGLVVGLIWQYVCFYFWWYVDLFVVEGYDLECIWGEFGFWLVFELYGWVILCWQVVFDDGWFEFQDVKVLLLVQLFVWINLVYDVLFFGLVWDFGVCYLYLFLEWI